MQLLLARRPRRLLPRAAHCSVLAAYAAGKQQRGGEKTLCIPFCNNSARWFDALRGKTLAIASPVGVNNNATCIASLSSMMSQ